MRRLLATSIFFATGIFAEGTVEVIRMDSSPYNERATIHKLYTENDLLGGKKNPLLVQVIDFPTGVFLQSRPDSFRGMREYGTGSSVMIMIYAPKGFQKRFYLNKQDAPSFPEARNYFKDNYRKEFTSSDRIPSGEVVVVAMLINSYGESIKSKSAKKTLVVDYGKKGSGESKFKDGLSKPHLIYNEPYGTFKKDEPIMLDFYLVNADLGHDAYKVEVYIDKKKEDTLYAWTPYKMRGLKPGKHDVQIILIDPEGNKVDDVFGPQKNIIAVE